MATTMAIQEILGIHHVDIGFNAAGVMDFQEIPPATDFNMEPQTDDRTYEGNNSTRTRTILTGLQGNFSTDSFSMDLLSKVTGSAIITTGLPADVARRLYMGSLAQEGGAIMALRCDVSAVLRATNTPKRLRVYVPKVTTRIYEPEDIGSQDTFGNTVNWESDRVTQELNGAALPGVPSGGVHYIYDELV